MTILNYLRYWLVHELRAVELEPVYMSVLS